MINRRTANEQVLEAGEEDCTRKQHINTHIQRTATSRRNDNYAPSLRGRKPGGPRFLPCAQTHIEERPVATLGPPRIGVAGSRSHLEAMQVLHKPVQNLRDCLRGGVFIRDVGERKAALLIHKQRRLERCSRLRVSRARAQQRLVLQ